jgi:hypothetical protein
MSEYNQQHNPFLDSIELSVRADRLLRAWGRVQSMDDFLNLKRSDFMALKGAGVKTWNEISDLQRHLECPAPRPWGHILPKASEMSLRDAAALAVLTGGVGNPWASCPEELARRCYRIADAFIAARETKIDD